MVFMPLVVALSRLLTFVALRQTGKEHDQRHKYHHLTTTFHLTLKMTTTQVVEKSVNNNSLSEDLSRPYDHTRQTTGSTGFKPFTTRLFFWEKFFEEPTNIS